MKINFAIIPLALLFKAANGVSSESTLLNPVNPIAVASDNVPSIAEVQQLTSTSSSLEPAISSTSVAALPIPSTESQNAQLILATSSIVDISPLVSNSVLAPATSSVTPNPATLTSSLLSSTSVYVSAPVAPAGLSSIPADVELIENQSSQSVSTSPVIQNVMASALSSFSKAVSTPTPAVVQTTSSAKSSTVTPLQSDSTTTQESTVSVSESTTSSSLNISPVGPVMISQSSSIPVHESSQSISASSVVDDPSSSANSINMPTQVTSSTPRSVSTSYQVSQDVTSYALAPTSSTLDVTTVYTHIDETTTYIVTTTIRSVAYYTPMVTKTVLAPGASMKANNDAVYTVIVSDPSATNDQVTSTITKTTVVTITSSGVDTAEPATATIKLDGKNVNANTNNIVSGSISAVPSAALQGCVPVTVTVTEAQPTVYVTVSQAPVTVTMTMNSTNYPAYSNGTLSSGFQGNGTAFRTSSTYMDLTNVLTSTSLTSVVETQTKISIFTSTV